MEIKKGSDFVLFLDLKDIKGKPLRVRETDYFKLYVWTTNSRNALIFVKNEIDTRGNVDRVIIPSLFMGTLESGVIIYSYDYSLPDSEGKHFDGKHHKVREVVTDYYWRNTNHNGVPALPINQELVRYFKDLVHFEKIEREKDIALLKKYINVDFNDRLNEEIIRSTDKDDELSDTIKNVEAGLKNDDEEIRLKLADEIKRSTEVDIQMFNLIKEVEGSASDSSKEVDGKVSEENSRAQEAENKLADEINKECERATKAEADIKDELLSLRDKIKNRVDKLSNIDQKLRELIEAEKERSNDMDVKLTNALTIEINRAKAEENRIETLLNTEVTRSTGRDNELSGAIDAEANRAKLVEKDITEALQSLKSSVNNKVSGLSDDLDGEISRAKKAEKNISDNLDSEINRATSKENELANSIGTTNTALANEVSRATAKESEISSNLSSLSNNLTAEISRSLDKDNELGKAITDEVLRATLKENELDGKINSNLSGINTINQKLEVINADENTIGSIKHGVADSKHYTDDQIAKLKSGVESGLADTLKDYATKSDVDNKIKEVVGTAPEALDTLGEIADLLSKDNDAIKAINTILAGKANSDEVYTKSETDSKVSGINDALATEVSRATDRENSLASSLTNEIERAKASEKVLADNLDSANSSINEEIARAKTAEKDINDNLNSEIERAVAKDNELTGAISTEVSRATAAENKLTTDLDTESTRAREAEKVLAGKIDIINGDKDTIGSMAHYLEDSKHYTDDEISKLKGNLERDLTDETNRAINAEKEIKETIRNIQSNLTDLANDTYTKDEINKLLETINNKIDEIKDAIKWIEIL